MGGTLIDQFGNKWRVVHNTTNTTDFAPAVTWVNKSTQQFVYSFGADDAPGCYEVLQGLGRRLLVAEGNEYKLFVGLELLQPNGSITYSCSVRGEDGDFCATNMWEIRGY